MSLNNINNAVNADKNAAQVYANVTDNYHEAKSVTPIKIRYEHRQPHQQSFDRRVGHGHRSLAEIPPDKILLY